MKGKTKSYCVTSTVILAEIVEHGSEGTACSVENQSCTAYRWQCMPGARVLTANSKKFEKTTVLNSNESVKFKYLISNYWILFIIYWTCVFCSKFQKLYNQLYITYSEMWKRQTVLRSASFENQSFFLMWIRGIFFKYYWKKTD